MSTIPIANERDDDLLRRKNKEIYATEVRFYGAIDRQDGEIRAWVNAPSVPPNIGYGRNALALLVPLAAVKGLVLSTSAPSFTVATRDAFADGAANLLDRGADDLHDFRLGVPGLPMFLQEGEGETPAIWSGCLMRSRKGGYWVRGHGPLQGGPSFALWGVLGLFEHVARNYVYEETALPMAVGIRTLIELTDEFDGEWQAMGDAAEDFLGGYVAGVVASPDPFEALKLVKQAIS